METREEADWSDLQHTLQTVRQYKHIKIAMATYLLSISAKLESAVVAEKIRSGSGGATFEHPAVFKNHWSDWIISYDVM